MPLVSSASSATREDLSATGLLHSPLAAMLDAGKLFVGENAEQSTTESLSRIACLVFLPFSYR